MQIDNTCERRGRGGQGWPQCSEGPGNPWVKKWTLVCRGARVNWLGVCVQQFVPGPVVGSADFTKAFILHFIIFIFRWDMSKVEDYYWNDEMRRTLEDIVQRCTQKKDNFGCILPPLLNIKLDNVRVDELHLLLRITGMYTSVLC